jgi:hypothetical protein
LGTTKYCSRYLKGATCQKADCLYLHEPGDPLASFTKEQMQQGYKTIVMKNKNIVNYLVFILTTNVNLWNSIQIRQHRVHRKMDEQQRMGKNFYL